MAARWALLVALTAAGTAGLDVLAVPSPALFAGLVAAALLALLGRGPGRVARPLSTSAQAVVGVVIGVLARPETLIAVARDWLPVLVVGSGTLALSMAAGLLLGRRPGVSPLTGMLALTAGGASGLVAVSRELGGDERVVAVIQYLRVVLVTVSMPLVAATVYGASGAAGPGPAAAGGPWYVGLLLTVVCGAVGVPLARLLRVPAGGLLGPMTVALVLTLTGVAGDATPPAVLVELAFAVIGWQAGVRFTPESLRHGGRAAPGGRRADRRGRAGVGGAGGAARAAHRRHAAGGLPGHHPGRDLRRARDGDLVGRRRGVRRRGAGPAGDRHAARGPGGGAVGGGTRALETGGDRAFLRYCVPWS